MAISQNHYQTLDVKSNATQAEIKQAYRRLAKLFHPDRNQTTDDHNQIVKINLAYEVLGDPNRRQSYDQQLQVADRLSAAGFAASPGTRSQRTAAAQAHYRHRRQAEPDLDEHLRLWLDRVHTPVNRLLTDIMRPLKAQLNELAADPFDDDLMEEFQVYLEDCRAWLNKAQKTFQAMPNPPQVAGVAAHLYYCLNQLGDGLEELAYFPLNYDEHHLHTGYELFRIAEGLRREAQSTVRSLPR
jgi:molecular chaperone DnaJ